jgi:hypothetical protein
MKTTVINILRWIAIIPAALLSYFLGYALYKVIFWISDRLYSHEDGWMALYITPAIAAGAAGYFFITSGHWLAPMHKRYAALGLLIIISMIMGIAVFTGAIYGQVMGIVESVASVVGAVIGYIQCLEDENDY